MSINIEKDTEDYVRSPKMYVEKYAKQIFFGCSTHIGFTRFIFQLFLCYIRTLIP